MTPISRCRPSARAILAAASIETYSPRSARYTSQRETPASAASLPLVQRRARRASRSWKPSADLVRRSSSSSAAGGGREKARGDIGCQFNRPRLTRRFLGRCPGVAALVPTRAGDHLRFLPGSRVGPVGSRVGPAQTVEMISNPVGRWAVRGAFHELARQVPDWGRMVDRSKSPATSGLGILASVRVSKL